MKEQIEDDLVACSYCKKIISLSKDDPMISFKQEYKGLPIDKIPKKGSLNIVCNDCYEAGSLD